MAIVRRQQQQEQERGGLARRYDPFDLMQDLMRWDPFREMTRGLGGTEGTWVPSFEVKETNDAYIFKGDLPGVKEDQLEISLTGNRLTISGRREEEKRDEGETYYVLERSYGTFSRTFTLPEGIDPEHVRAELKDGVLSVVVPKKPEVQPKRIEVKAGSGEQKEQAKA
jgi:HSP20 family protein